MAKLQPSKLIMRVRFPLPAFFVELRMKMVYLIIALLFGGVLVPAVHAATARQQAVSLASKKNSIAAIGNAVYHAVKAEPQKVGEICEEVLSQRTNWTAEECSVIIRAALMARPDMKRGFITWVTQGGKAAAEMDVATAETNRSLLDFVQRLHLVTLEDGVLEAAIVMAAGAPGQLADGLPRAAGHDGSSEGLPPILELIVTPSDMSTNQ